MFSSKFFRNTYRAIMGFRASKSFKIDYPKILGIGTVASGMVLYSFSSVMCNTEQIKEFLVGSVEEIPEGGVKKVQIGESEDNFILVSQVEGKFYATGGKCSHYGAPLNAGYLDGYSIICPWHNASFDVRTGELLDAPGNDSIPTYTVEIKAGHVIVHIPESKLNAVSKSIHSKRLVKRDPNDHRAFVILGGGAAGNSAAETLRREGYTGKITIVTDEKHLPYDRTVISKSFKANASDLILRNADFYNLYDIEVQQEAEVKSIDADKKIVKLSNGNEILYDKLLLATGSSANLSPKLKIYLKNFDNFFTLRSADDHTAIKKKIEEANEIVILGVGFIGLEVASAIITTWPAKKVTLISRDEEPMSNVLGKEIANQLLNALKAKGVRIFKGSKNHKIESKLGDLVNVSLPNRHTHAGKIVDQEIKTDLILVASGASPRTSYVPQNLVNPDGSIRVNSHLQTEDSSIYAAGDIAEFPSLLTEDRQRVEHWAVAQQQGRLAALNMLEKGQHYVDVPFFWSRQLASIGFAGFSKGHDWSYTETKLTENVDQTSRITYFYKGERCIGIAAVNWHGAVQRLKIALHRGLMPTKNELLNKTAHYETIAEKVKNSNPCRGNCCH